MPSVLCWRPIAGPSATYTLTQSHPLKATIAPAIKQHVTLSDSSSSSSIDSGIFASYLNTANSFLDNNAEGHEETIFDSTDGRVLSGGKSYFSSGGKHYNGLFSGVSSGVSYFKISIQINGSKQVLQN